MKDMTLNNIAEACGGVLIAPEDKRDLAVSGVVIDSRKVEEGFLFVPIKGARADGHDFIPSVFEKGAACSLSERELPDCPGPYIRVRSTEQALKDIAAFYRSRLDPTVIGITGSVGKTSTKETIASVLGQRFRVLRTEGNFNNEIGLPLTVFRLKEEHEIAVLEMGISDFGEMHRLASIAKPDICVITNIGQCHLENLGDRDGVFRAKTEMFDHMSENGRVFLNGDDDKLAAVKEVRGHAPFLFGLDKDFAAWADDIENLGLRGTSCTLRSNIAADRDGGTRTAEIPVTIPIPGSHMVYNALAAAAVGFFLGMEPEEVRAGIEALAPIGGRNRLIETENLLILDDCYNANPVSMRAGIDVLARADGRKVCILGDMGELGDNSPALHRETGRYAGNAGIDLILLAGPLSKDMAEGARETARADSVNYYPNKQSLIAALPGLIKKGDAILVKASHAMGFEDIVEALAAQEKKTASIRSKTAEPILASASPKSDLTMVAYQETGDLFADTCEIVESAQRVAYAAVDTILVQRNWLLGKRIAIECLNEEGKADYGKKTMKKLSAELKEKYGKGFDFSSLYKYVKFHQTFPEILDSLNPKSGRPLSWTHYRILLQETSPEARAWYAKEAQEQAWSVRTLQRNVSSQYYYRMLMSQNTEPVEKEMKALTASYQSDKLEFIKNPVIAEFLGLASNTEFTETELEQRIITHIQKFLMEMGKGYAFVARQQHIRTEKEDYYIDLVFYNYILKCFVLIDLKTSKITHQDVGQMDMYIRIYDEMKRSEGDNPTLGIILCSDTDEDIAKYSVLHGHEQLFASKYKTCLPSEEQLREEIEIQKRFYYLQKKEEEGETENDAQCNE